MNLLLALDALLAEDSVTGAASRLGLSLSAMSRTLARLRSAVGDPLLVRAGRNLVPTPRAIEMRAHVRELTRQVQSVLGPQTNRLELGSLERTFTIRTSAGFLELFAAPLIAAVAQAAPRVRLRFVSKPIKDAAPLRDGQVDLEIGVLGEFAPEVLTRFIFRDKFVGVVRAGHPLLASPVTPERYAACQHVVVSRKASFTGPVDDALETLGLTREIAAVVPGHPDAVRIARQSDLVALVPSASFHSAQAHGDLSLASFDLPVPTPEITVSAMWHPRLDADLAHRWLRDTVITTCRAAVRQSSVGST
jgi:DNA-binding transcriptional LysR family regulator